MGRWEHRYLGWDRFPDPSTPLEIEHLFTLEADELACAKARRTPSHRLAVALHIVFLKTTGRLLNSVEIVPVSVLEHLGRQLGCTPPRITSIRALYRRRRTLFDHQEVALDVLGLDTLGGHAERGLVAYLSPTSGARPCRRSIPASSWHAPGPGSRTTAMSCLTSGGCGISWLAPDDIGNAVSSRPLARRSGRLPCEAGRIG